MPTVSYKCPSCDAGLIFDPASGKFKCEYCNSQFDVQELAEAQSEAKPAEEKQAEPDRAAGEEDFSKNALYQCPSCGAEIITDETTAATFCLYCHNPVILSGKVDGAYKPHRIIPFSVEKSKVEELFREWCKKKKFIQEEFISQASKDMIRGVYFPFWVVDSDVSAGMSARGETVRVWRAGNTEYTETKIYTIIRDGDIFFNDVTVKALDQKEVNILEGLHPYDIDQSEPFSMTYLSGFFAEKRNIEKDAAKPVVDKVIGDCSARMLQSTMQGYSSISVIESKAVPENENWLYVLLPAWMFAYQYKGETYFFAMNGQSGKIAGRVPASPKKLLALFAGLTAGIAGILILLGWLI